MNKLSDARQIEIVELRQQMQAKDKMRLQEIADWKEKYEMDIDAVETTAKNQLKLCKMIFSAEVEVLA